jgi:hypothetical protein
MSEPCTGGGGGIGQLGRVWNVRGMELSWEVIGEGQTRMFLDVKVKWLVRYGCKGCYIV